MPGGETLGMVRGRRRCPLMCRAFALRCMRILAGTLQAVLWRHCTDGASVLVVQLCEAVCGSADAELAEHGIAALQAVAEASVAALGLHSRSRPHLGCADWSQREDALDAVAMALAFLLHELQGPEMQGRCAAKALEVSRSTILTSPEWQRFVPKVLLTVRMSRG